ncbi:MAG TPA: DUF4157 domain-containing protein [Blastocatellia bacterium]|nr:DUF4157 domain-containing protein [Blastocatellia bacterium]
MANKMTTHAAEKGSAAVRKPAVEAQASRRQPTPVHPAAALLRAMSGPASELSASDIRALQRTAGNRAVQRMLGALMGQNDERSSAQALHQFSEPSDHHQPVADSVVSQIVNPSHALPPQSSTPTNAIQRRVEEAAEPLQGKFENARKEENRTGLPDSLKTGIENLSGISLDDVKVHHNSSAPAQVQALAYTQGTDIHLGPGQERHLPHEAWHVVQQKQGRVGPTIQVKGVSANDDQKLEQEADEQGRRAIQQGNERSQRKAIPGGESRNAATPLVQRQALNRASVVQFVAPTPLKEIKENYDLIDPLIQPNIIEGLEPRIEIMEDVPDLKKGWKTSTKEYKKIWNLWSPIYTENTKPQPTYPAWPSGRGLYADRDNMKGYLATIKKILGLLSDNGLAELKEKLAYRWYLKAKGVQGTGGRFFKAPLNESLSDFKTRVKAKISDWIKPGKDLWLSTAGYKFDTNPYVKQLAKLNDIPLHWTLYRRNLDMGKIDALKTTDSADKAVELLIPNGAGTSAVHVTSERYGADSVSNPRVFGRPADVDRHLGGEGDGITFQDMAGRLDEENNRRSGLITRFRNDRNDKIRDNWDSH